MEEFNEIKLGLYKHFKGNFYRVTGFAYHHQAPTMSRLVIYHKCDENGVFMSIRKLRGIDDEVILPQPFYRTDVEFMSMTVVNDIGVSRFTFIKEL